MPDSRKAAPSMRWPALLCLNYIGWSILAWYQSPKDLDVSLTAFFLGFPLVPIALLFGVAYPYVGLWGALNGPVWATAIEWQIRKLLESPPDSDAS